MSRGRSLGEPYQIYSEIVNTGKTVEGTKKRVKWLFGWSDDSAERDHEVELVHSLVSGKKTVYEDGREVTTSTKMLSSDFSHGWNSNGYVFRVEATIQLSSEPIYMFTIDGARFPDLPFKPQKRRGSITKSKVEDKVDKFDSESSTWKSAEGTSKQKSLGAKKLSAGSLVSGSGSSAAAARRGSSGGGAAAFDPFGTDNTSSASFDPFSNVSSGGLPAATKGGSPALKRVGGTKPSPVVVAAAAVSLLDDDPVPYATSTSASSFDPFGSSSSSAGSSSALQQSQSQSSSFDPFGSSDPFGNSNNNKSSTSSVPKKSAQDILSMDLAGLSFAAPAVPATSVYAAAAAAAGPMTNSSVATLAPQPPFNPFGQQQPAVEPHASSNTFVGQQQQQFGVQQQQPLTIKKDSSSSALGLDTKLVNLNLLDPKVAAKAQTAARAGPSLGSLLAVSDQRMGKPPVMLTPPQPPMLNNGGGVGGFPPQAPMVAGPGGGGMGFGAGPGPFGGNAFGSGPGAMGQHPMGGGSIMGGGPAPSSFQGGSYQAGGPPPFGGQPPSYQGGGPMGGGIMGGGQIGGGPMMSGGGFGGPMGGGLGAGIQQGGFGSTMGGGGQQGGGSFGMGTMAGSSIPVNSTLRTGTISSITGGTARGVPSASSGPKSSLDNLDWKTGF